MRPFDDGSRCERQVDGERAAVPGRAHQADLAAQQADEAAADRKAKAGAAVLAGGRAVGLGEGLEHRALQLLLDADAGVADADRHDGVGADEAGAVGAPAAPAQVEAHLDLHRRP